MLIEYKENETSLHLQDKDLDGLIIKYVLINGVKYELIPTKEA